MKVVITIKYTIIYKMSQVNILVKTNQKPIVDLQRVKRGNQSIHYGNSSIHKGRQQEKNKGIEELQNSQKTIIWH